MENVFIFLYFDFIVDLKVIKNFLPYQTNKDRSTFFGDILVIVGSFFGYDPCLFGRGEILVIFGLQLGRNDDLINSF